MIVSQCGLQVPARDLVFCLDCAGCDTRLGIQYDAEENIAIETTVFFALNLDLTVVVHCVRGAAALKF